MKTKNIQRLTNTVLSLYIATVIALTFCDKYQSFILTTILVFFAGFVLLLILCEVTRKKQINHDKHFDSSKNNLKFAIMVFSVVLCGQLFYYFAYYPGGFNLDALGQWGQAHGDYPYDDWHPFISTIWIKLILLIHDSLPFYIFSQVLIFSTAFAKLSNSLSGLGVRHAYIIACAIFVSLSPAIGMNNVCLTKDVQFTILIILLTDISIQMMLTPSGDWLLKPFNIYYTVAVLFLASTVRHNGVLYTIPFLLLLAIIYRERIRQIFIVVIVTLVSIIIVKGPVEQALNVAPHSNTVGESIGIPMAIMANALVNDPDNLPSDVHGFLNQIAEDCDWNEYYITGEWDSCKWEFGGVELLQDASLSDILTETAKTIIKCPQASYESIRENTRIFWQVIGDSSNWTADMYFCENEYGLQQTPILVLNHIANKLVQLSKNLCVNWLIWNIGFDIFAFVVLLYFSLNYNSLRMTLLLVPLLCYDFGTMLLLAGPNHRYFYLNKCLLIPILLCGIQTARSQNQR